LYGEIDLLVANYIDVPWVSCGVGAGKEQLLNTTTHIDGWKVKNESQETTRRENRKTKRKRG
jgi:hypothetical protein